MAAPSKPTGVHYALVVFVLISIVCGLGWLLAYKGANSISDLRAERDTAKKNETTQKKLADGYYADLTKIKELLGAKYEEVGDGSNPNTVAGAIVKLMRDYNKGGTDPTLSGTMVKQDQFIGSTLTERDTLQENLARAIAEFQQKEKELNAALAAEKASREAADKKVVDADNEHKELQQKKDEDIAQLRKAIADEQQQAGEFKDAAEKKIKDLETRITGLTQINKKLIAELDEKTRPSFEVPDGWIRWIDPVGKKVWISLGEADGLKPRATFSVYKKTNSGIGRGTQKGQVGGQDIKGAIEVTRVLEADLSEARIIDEDLYAPIAKGDPIYSPLWSPGRGEAFSIVGIMDLDGDGKDDRDLLLEQVRTAGATVDNDIDEKGVLRVNGKIPDDNKPRITEKTKFVVIGKIGEISETADPDEIATIQKIQELRKELEDAARERGVRVLSLSDFLVYIGYKQQRRLFVPGGDIPYKLKAGSHSASVDESSGSSRKSGGTTSSAYSGEKGTKAKTFTGGSTSGSGVFRK
ncbi:MAG: hypothetical protein ACM3U2_24180 [Deltaproteobacteria bacterium]